ncbi:hypothetical protein MMC24_001223 [Lignoscripta atroalba]|nr:hypothetical protein [Lignoscripta atroalba]
MPPNPPLTHFLCLPLVTPSSTPQLQASLQHFITDVSSAGDEPGTSIPVKAIRPLGTLHLTLGVMSLVTQERIDAALACLHGLDVQELLRKTGRTESAVEGPVAIPQSDMKTERDQNVETSVPGSFTLPPSDPVKEPTVALTVSLVGLAPMHRPSSTSILYINPQDSSSRLYPFCLALRTAFTSASIIVPDSRPLLLHATIVNTIYAKGRGSRSRGGGHGANSKVMRGIDARDLLERYAGFVWAEGIRLERISICEMRAKKVMNEGVVVGEKYVEIGIVPLP